MKVWYPAAALLIAFVVAVGILMATLDRSGSPPAAPVKILFSEKSSFTSAGSATPVPLTAEEMALLNRLFAQLERVPEQKGVDALGTLTGEWDGRAVAVEVVAAGKRPVLCKIGGDFYSRMGEYASTSDQHVKYIDESQTLHSYLTAPQGEKKFFADLLRRSAKLE